MKAKQVDSAKAQALERTAKVLLGQVVRLAGLRGCRQTLPPSASPTSLDPSK